LKGYFDIGPGKNPASKAVIVFGDSHPHIDLPVCHRAAQVGFCFFFAGAN
jgi:hypothetical protein